MIEDYKTKAIRKEIAETLARLEELYEELFTTQQIERDKFRVVR